MANKSKIYKEITIQDTKKIVKDIFEWDTEVETFKILSGGMFNTTHFIETVKPSKKLVLRVARIRQELLFDFEKNMMSAEPGIYELLRSNNIPVPKEDKDNIQVELGGYAAKIHNIKSKIFGRPNPDNTVRGHGKWSEVIREFTEE